MALNSLLEQIRVGIVPVLGDAEIGRMIAELMLQVSRIEAAAIMHPSPSMSLPNVLRGHDEPRSYPRHSAAVCTMEITSCVLLTMSEI